LPDVALKDCTGYIDKDVEKYYTVWDAITKKDKFGNDKTDYIAVESLMNVDIYPDIYLDSKKGGK
jgi:hypothetical protein